jgi:hypothetical protein
MEIAFKFLVHEQYSRDLSKKIKTAKRIKALRGEYIMKNCAFGFKKVGNRLEIDETAAETVRIIYDLAADGQSLTQIAARLYNDKRPTPTEYKQLAHQVLAKDFSCVWGKPQILDILSNEQYIGTYIAGKTKILEVGSGKAVKVDESEWIKIPDHHPAIIDKDLYAAAREKIDQRGEPLRNRKVGTWHRYRDISSSLKGKVFCGCCNHTMILSNTKNAAFHCNFTRAAPDAPCHRLKILEAGLTKMVFNMIRKNKALSATENDNVPRSQFEQEHERLVASCRKEKLTLYERFVNGEFSAEDYKTAKTAQEVEIDRLTKAYAAIKKTAAARTSEKRLRELMEAALHDKTPSRELMELLIDKICVFPDGKITIAWKFAD